MKNQAGKRASRAFKARGRKRKYRAKENINQQLNIIKYGLLGALNLMSCMLLQTVMIRYIKWEMSLIAAIAQAWNMLFGYILYGKIYFGTRLKDTRTIIRYACQNLINLAVNWVFISSNIGELSKEEKTAIILPIIACVSYFIQKNMIFVKPTKKTRL